ncbi:hypothetical protein E5288_WYG006709 [Bos mutus]|uniref:Uncharacterized protein n=1 Tax=Bos mutus TaxID=72004 RepID=A0A6B0RKP5_9CETA|nr:hypothetical protein [Bos mutus]
MTGGARPLLAAPRIPRPQASCDLLMALRGAENLAGPRGPAGCLSNRDQVSSVTLTHQPPPSKPRLSFSTDEKEIACGGAFRQAVGKRSQDEETHGLSQTLTEPGTETSLSPACGDGRVHGEDSSLLQARRRTSAQSGVRCCSRKSSLQRQNEPRGELVRSRPLRTPIDRGRESDPQSTCPAAEFRYGSVLQECQCFESSEPLWWKSVVILTLPHWLFLAHAPDPGLVLPKGGLVDSGSQHGCVVQAS